MPSNQRQQTSAVAVVEDRSLELLESEDERRRVFREKYLKNLTPVEYEMMIAEATHRGLDPFANEYASIKFGNNPATFFPTIHGLRKLALRSERFDGMVKEWCGRDGVWREIWLEITPPAGARCKVFVKGARLPFVGIATWTERRRTYWKDGKERLMDNWEKQPAHMLAKCAERDALAASGIIADIPPLRAEILNSDAFLVGEPVDYELTEEAGRDPRVDAMRGAHAAAKEHGGHELVRETAKALEPEIVSTKQATAATLRQAADAIEVFEERAPAVIAADSPVDDDTGEFREPTALELWRIHIREMEGQPKELATLAEEAGDDVERWCALIDFVRHWPAVQRLYGLGMKALPQADRPMLYDAHAKREQAEREQSQVAVAAAKRRAIDEAPTEEPTADPAPPIGNQHGLPGVAAASPK